MGQENFDIHFEATAAGYRVRVDSPMGYAIDTSFELPFGEVELENYLLKFGASAGRTRRLESSQRAAGREFGSRLFAALFTEQIYARFSSCLDQARLQQSTLRIRLDFQQAPELVGLPWELLYDAQSDSFPALSKVTPLIRFLPTAQPVVPLEVTQTLNVLCALSSPSDFSALDVTAERGSMQQAVSPLEQQEVLRVQWLEHATLHGLRTALNQTQCHIVHFVGHGYFDREHDEGALVFEQENGRARLVSASSLATILRDKPSVRLVVLNACEGAQTGDRDQFAGVAPALLRAGLPAVIAMQFPISDKAAILFTREFYTQIAAGRPVDAALTEARLALFAEDDTLEWVNPVLYSRQSEGRLFDLPLAAPIPPTSQPADSPRGKAVEQPKTTRRSAAAFGALVSIGILAVGVILAILFLPGAFRNVPINLIQSGAEPPDRSDQPAQSTVSEDPGSAVAAVVSQTTTLDLTPPSLPTGTPTVKPVSTPTEFPSAAPSRTPTSVPTATSTATATQEPVPTPTRSPTATPPATVTPTTVPAIVWTSLSLADIATDSMQSGYVDPPLGEVQLAGIPFYLPSGMNSATTQTESLPDNPTVLRLANIAVPNPTYAYFLITGGNVLREFAGRKVGHVEFRYNTGERCTVDLILGENIREWKMTGDQNVTWLGGRAAEEVLRTANKFDEGDAVIDLLTVGLPPHQQAVILEEIAIVDTSIESVGSMKPAINLLGVTVSGH